MIPETHYAKTPDDVYLAYQTVGEGPIDLVWQFEWCGNVDAIWDHRPYGEWLTRLASFSRVILHDRRGTGASSRNVDPPNLETRVADLTVVLDAVGTDRVVLGGALEAGAPNVLFAASVPERVLSLFWWYPAPRTTLAPDYPFGAPESLLAEATHDIVDNWGTDAYGMSEMETFASENEPFPWGRLTRQTATPDVAVAMDAIYNQTDVRGAMPAISAPVLLLAREQDRAALEYLSSLLRNPQIRLFPGQGSMKLEEMPAVLDAIRTFAGLESRPELDTILSTVLFTDVVDSTRKQASMGDHRYKGLIEHHHAIVRDELRRWRGVESDTAGDGFYATFDGPARADPMRAPDRRAGPRSRDRDPRWRAYGGVRVDRREDRRPHRVDRGTRGGEGERLRGPRVPDRQGSGGGVGIHVRRGRGARAQRRARDLAGLPGRRLTRFARHTVEVSAVGDRP